MSASAPSEAVRPIVHGLLICRNATQAGEGRLDLENVLEVVALDELPGDAGPLVFVAFLREVPLGKRTAAFVVRPMGTEHVTARMPLDVNVPAAFAGRMVVLQVRLQSIPVQQGGWYDVLFEWEGQVLAANRFAIGAKQ